MLDTILDRLAGFMEKSLRLRKKIIGASIYPIAVIIVAVIILAGIMIFVIPQFRKMFDDMNRELPVATEALLGIANVVKSWWFLIPAIPLLTWFGIKAIGSTQGGLRGGPLSSIAPPLERCAEPAALSGGPFRGLKPWRSETCRSVANRVRLPAILDCLWRSAGVS